MQRLPEQEVLVIPVAPPSVNNGELCFLPLAAVHSSQCLVVVWEAAQPFPAFPGEAPAAQGLCLAYVLGSAPAGPDAQYLSLIKWNCFLVKPLPLNRHVFLLAKWNIVLTVY